MPRKAMIGTMSTTTKKRTVSTADVFLRPPRRRVMRLYSPYIIPLNTAAMNTLWRKLRIIQKKTAAIDDLRPGKGYCDTGRSRLPY
jgi:hypothetical protein